jgi:hypothetical protein
MEDVLALNGLPRRAPEAPREYLDRALTRMNVSQRSLVSLTNLFELAKFSPHEIHEGNREEAIRALADVRDELGVGG